MKKKILLLNPPGKRLYVRDYFCSKVSKADYINAPVDLVMLSGILGGGDFELSLVDAIVERLSAEDCLAKIKNICPDAIVALTGSVSLEEDRDFLLKLSLECRAELFIIGDFLLTEGKSFLEENSHIKGVVLSFVSNGLRHYFLNQPELISDLLLRQDEEIIEYPKSVLSEFSVGLPLQAEFIKRNYCMPFVRRLPFATTLTSYACPFACTFCIMNTFKFMQRNIDDLFAELDYLHGLGVKEILFLDQTLGIDQKRFEAILNKMIEKKYGFGWFGFSRVDIVDRELLELMKRAGCHTLWFGVESASNTTLDAYKKGYDRDQIVRAFDAAKHTGIKTLATFIIGLPEETEQMIEDTIVFSRRLNPDFVSFNFAVPRFGTELRDKAINGNLIDGSMSVMDQSGSSIAMGTNSLGKDRIRKLKRKAILGFYLRPSYFWQRLTAINSWTEFKMNLRNFISLISNEL